MRIHVISPMWPSTESTHTGVFVKNLSTSLAALGFDVDNTAVLAGKGAGRRGRLEKHATLGARILRQARQPADCVLVHAPTWFAPLIEAVRKDKKLVVHTHGGEVYPHSRMEARTQPAVRWLCRRADLVVTPSRYYRGEVQRAFGVAEERMFVSPSGGVDTERFAPLDQTTAREGLGLPGAFYVGFMGRIVDDKGWDVFVDTIGTLVRRGHDVRGLVVGQGEARELLLERAAARCVAERIHMLGTVPQAELRPYLASLDVFMFPTRRGAEALGLGPIEALATGVPVVGSNAYAVPEYVVDGETGWLAPARDVEAFAAAVEHVITLDATERAALSSRAVEMGRRYDTRRVTEALAARLLEL
ncbi:MAG: glycosyltransferase family 4 protein [Deltaproteobacteria bacterium]|jgi:glycosyltransferase involved in cell wall biosynthesis